MPPIQKERWSVSLNKQGASPHKEISNKSESFEFKYDPWRSQSSFFFFPIRNAQTWALQKVITFQPQTVCFLVVF